MVPNSALTVGVVEPEAVGASISKGMFVRPSASAKVNSNFMLAKKLAFGVGPKLSTAFTGTHPYGALPCRSEDKSEFASKPSMHCKT